MVPLENYLVLSAILFSLGVYGVLARRNAVLVLMSVELMLNAVSLNFIAFAAYLDPERIAGVIFSIFVITVAAAEVGLALAIVIRLFRNRATSNVDEAALMKW
ncbi:MAG: NADH-quinone oxidoreductase subunit NuoK [Tepidiformaceae bacterium]